VNENFVELDAREPLDGEDGVGVPAGGTTGQALVKASGADYDTEWATAPASILEAVAGGAGFASASGAVTMNLAAARAFHHLMTGNITSLAFSNVPDPDASAAVWTWVLRVNGTGGYTFSSPPSVTWVDGRAWTDLDLSANAENIVTFWRVDTVTYARLVTNGSLELDPYKVCFLDNATITIIAEDESVDVANATKDGDGTITYKKGADLITTRTTFAEGNILSVICVSATGTTTVRIPRFAL